MTAFTRSFTQTLMTLIGLVLFSACAFADLESTTPMTPGLYTGISGRPTPLSQVAQQVTPGTIVIVSEIHNLKSHHDNQIRLLKRLHEQGLRPSVGMEFFYWPEQHVVDQYLQGQILEEQLLEEVEWGAQPFSLYREQVLFPAPYGGRTLALNAPRRLTGAIKEKGVEGLSPELQSLMPPDFEVGHALYYERFQQVMEHHVPREALPLYFEAQSTWDDTMAWQAVQHMKSQPNDILVILVGDFHATYGGGLPARIQARGHDKIMVISQVNGTGLREEEIIEVMEPSPDYGPRADYVWLSYEAKGGE